VNGSPKPPPLAAGSLSWATASGTANRCIVSQIILDALEAREMSYPKSSYGRRQELLSIRRQPEA